MNGEGRGARRPGLFSRARAGGRNDITADFGGAYVAINEQNPDLDPGFTGFDTPTTGSGTLTLSQADLSPGGAVAGDLVAHLTLSSVTADLQATFYAEIPAG